MKSSLLFVFFLLIVQASCAVVEQFKMRNSNFDKGEVSVLFDINLLKQYNVFSLNYGIDNVTQVFDVLQFQTSSVPEIILTYFRAQTKFDITDPSFTAESYRLGAAFSRIIEFYDVNKDNKYDETDVYISEKNLFTSLFGVFSSEEIHPTDNANAIILKSRISTLDNVFEMRSFISDHEVVETHTGAILTPNNTKLTLIINDYPFKNSSSKLALEVFYFSQNTGITFGNGIDIDADGFKGYFSWDSKAYLDDEFGESIKLKHSLQTNVQKDDKFRASLNIENNEEIGVLYFVVPTINPKYVFWDPSAGFGQDPERQGLEWWVFVLIGVVAIAVVVLIIGGIMFAIRRNRRRGYASL